MEPTDSPVITQALAGEEIKPGPHKIQGIGAGFIPGNLDLKLIDKVVTITNEEAISTARRLMDEKVFWRASLPVLLLRQRSNFRKMRPLPTRILWLSCLHRVSVT